jgi:hypothetical protein
MNKSLPWVLVAALAIALGASVFYYQGVIKEKEAQLAVAEQKLAAADSESQARLKEADAKLEKANSAIQKVSADARERLQTIAAEANKQISAASLPEARVAVTFRKAVLSSGNVAAIKNTSTQTAVFKLTVARPSTGTQKRFDLTLDSQRTKEIGEVEGWAFVQGDTLKIEQPEHKPLVLTLN